MVKISIVVESNKNTNNLDKCIESILNQTFQDFEIILISDDLSQNNSICNNFCNKFPDKITYCSDAQKKTSGKNIALNIANGELIYFIDPSKTIIDSTLSKISNIFDNDIDVVIFGKNIKNSFYTYEKTSALKQNTQTGKKIKIQEDDVINTDNNLYNKIYRKSIITQNKIYFSENTQYENFSFHFLYFIFSKNAIYLNENFYKQDTLIPDIPTFLPKDQILACKDLYEQLNKRGIYNKYKDLFSELCGLCILAATRQTSKGDKLKTLELAYNISFEMDLLEKSSIILPLLKRKRYDNIINEYTYEKPKKILKLPILKKRVCFDNYIRYYLFSKFCIYQKLNKDMSLSKLREITKENKNKELNLDCLDICIIIPAPIKGSGGHRNFFRAIKYLRDFGHNVTVYYTQTTQTADKVKKLVSDWFYDMDGINFVKFNGYLGYHDIGIATWWETAYNLADNIEFVKYPFYFVQDFEPWFYPMSSWYILAENSYRLGFTHICSGEWCKKFLEEKYNAKAEYFQFPLDTKIYNQKVQRTKFNKNIVFFAKPEMARRCYEFGLKVFSIISILRPDIEIIFYGSNQLDPKDIPFKCTVLKILPTLDDLANLYRNADLGVVFSTTNPSLVPYEMMSCGCPVADMNISNAISKYGNNEDNVFLFEANPDIFAQKILDIIDNKDILQQKATAGAIWVKNEFPTELQMAKIVENIIKTTIKNTENLNLK